MKPYTLIISLLAIALLSGCIPVRKDVATGVYEGRCGDYDMRLVIQDKSLKVNGVLEILPKNNNIDTQFCGALDISGKLSVNVTGDNYLNLNGQYEDWQYYPFQKIGRIPGFSNSDVKSNRDNMKEAFRYHNDGRLIGSFLQDWDIEARQSDTKIYGKILLKSRMKVAGVGKHKYGKLGISCDEFVLEKTNSNIAAGPKLKYKEQCSRIMQ